MTHFVIRDFVGIFDILKSPEANIQDNFQFFSNQLGGSRVAVTVSVLGSSSSGNCTFIATSRVKLLLDVGFSRNQIAKRLVAIGEALEDIDALIISHEHLDHVKGLASLLKQYDILTFVGEATYEALTIKPVLKKRESIRAGESFQVGDLKISPFSIPHDATDPLAFTLEAEGLKISHVMDLGFITELVRCRMEASDVLVLESNHDLEMLRLSSYPWAVKQRIMGRHGHLSNESVGKFFAEDFDGKAGNIFLAHLSENNNHPDLARMVARKALEKRGFNLSRLFMARRSSPSPVIRL